MTREKMIEQVEAHPGYWDVLVIGGGASGLGAAVEAASRGYKTLLLEQHDFAKATSSRSTKLIHGGVRYLQQGNISLVLEALHERGLLIRNAPHLVHHQSFVVPNYEWWEGPFYGVGLKVYDLLAGKLGLKPSRILSREEVLDKMPTLEPKGLRGGVIYYDGQFDDARLAINLMQTILDLNGSAINYMPVTDLIKNGGVIQGVTANDLESGKSLQINSRVVINATGIFSDNIRRMDDPALDKIIAHSQGVHLMLDRKFLPGDAAILVPHTDDGRVLFAVPWHDRVVVGTTDTPVPEASLEPRAQEAEIDFILEHAAKYLTKDPTRADVLSVFAGLRPLVSPEGAGKTSEISRDHHLEVSSAGLVTIAGGKWTTYRKMAEDTIDRAAMVAGLNAHKSTTSELRIHGWLKNIDGDDPLYFYGSDAPMLKKLIKEKPALGEKLHPELPYCAAEVIWGVRREMARTVEDVLARRTRAILLNARACIEIAPAVARLMAAELGRDSGWQADQVAMFTALAEGYLC